MNYFELTYTNLKDSGDRMVLLSVAGCSHRCNGCNKPHMWDFNGGTPFDENAKAKLMSMTDKPEVKGVIITGGEPMDNYDDIVSIISSIRTRYSNKSIWFYTGYTLREAAQRDTYAILDKVDVVVDGPYIEELHDDTLPFRGSSNQVIWKRSGIVYEKSELNEAKDAQSM